MLVFVANVNAQKDKGEVKCKFDVEKKDAFNGGDYKSVKISMVEGNGPFGPRFYFEFFKANNSYSVKIQFGLNTAVREIVPLGTELTIKLANGEMVHLYSSVETVPVIMLGEGYGTALWTIPFDLSTDNLSKLANSYPTNWKCDFGTQNILHEISSKYGEKVSISCKCLLK